MNTTITLDYNQLVDTALANPSFFDLLVELVDAEVSAKVLVVVLAKRGIELTEGDAQHVIDALTAELSLAHSIVNQYSANDLFCRVRWQG